MNDFTAAIMIWNVIVFLIYGTDKLLAKLGAWRISEKMLFTTAFLLGGVGAFLGMRIFRHKTRHQNFKMLIPLSALITLAAVYLRW